MSVILNTLLSFSTYFCHSEHPSVILNEVKNLSTDLTIIFHLILILP